MYLKDGSLISIDVGILSKDITEYIINLKKQFLNKIVISIIGYSKLLLNLSIIVEMVLQAIATIFTSLD